MKLRCAPVLPVAESVDPALVLVANKRVESRFGEKIADPDAAGTNWGSGHS